MDEKYMRLRVEQWVSQFISPYCSNCEDNCCNATKQLINIGKEEPAVKFFVNIGLKLYRSDELDISSVKNWMSKRLTGKVLTKDKGEVSQPSLIEAPLPTVQRQKFKLGKDTDYVLYAKGYCPLYEERRGCLIHGDPRRPQSCKEYPLNFDTDGQRSVINIHNSCPTMRSPDMKRQLKFEFPDLPVFALSELIGDSIMRSARKKLKKRR